jgi:hypothetical protein
MGISLTSFPPRHRGELAVYQQLTLQQDDALYLWSSLDFIPGVNDIDLLIWHQEIGCFVVEIKAIPLQMLVSFSFSSCEIEGRGLDRSPQNQAYDGMQSLRNYLAPRVEKTPFMVATVCWPLISRSEWTERFRHSTEISLLSNSMLMKDDLYSGAESLRIRLREIWVRPPVRKGSSYPFKHERDIFRDFCHVLDPKAIPQPIKSDLAKLEALEKGIKRDLMRSFPPFATSRVLFHGKPGTGKTFRLQQIGIMHAREGAKVLLCCFNQVLASEFIRFINLIDANFKQAGVENSIKEFIDVVDITSFALRLCSDIGISIEIKDFNEWGQLITDDFKKPGVLDKYPKYDTVLIDESQDFSSWQIELTLLLATKDATVAMGVGSGQELYLSGDSGEKVAQLQLSTYKSANLRRNFRNAKPIYELAHLISECDFDLKRINDVYSKTFLNKKNIVQDIEFEISQANIPLCLYINDELQTSYDEPGYQHELLNKLAHEYQNIIIEHFLNSNQNPSDLLILVPDTVGDEITALRAALSKIYSELQIDYIDYVDKSSRKYIAPEGKIRVVTFHSSRGLEASNVLILGIEKLQQLSRFTKVEPSRLGYIAISRAIFNLVICFRSSKKNALTKFIEDAVSHINVNYG